MIFFNNVVCNLLLIEDSKEFQKRMTFTYVLRSTIASNYDNEMPDTEWEEFNLNELIDHLKCLFKKLKKFVDNLENEKERMLFIALLINKMLNVVIYDQEEYEDMKVSYMLTKENNNSLDISKPERLRDAIDTLEETFKIVEQEFNKKKKKANNELNNMFELIELKDKWNAFDIDMDHFEGYFINNNEHKDQFDLINNEYLKMDFFRKYDEYKNIVDIGKSVDGKNKIETLKSDYENMRNKLNDLMNKVNYHEYKKKHDEQREKERLEEEKREEEIRKQYINYVNIHCENVSTVVNTERKYKRKLKK